jgi:hypothetical protein
VKYLHGKFWKSWSEFNPVVLGAAMSFHRNGLLQRDLVYIFALWIETCTNSNLQCSEVPISVAGNDVLNGTSITLQLVQGSN